MIVLYLYTKYISYIIAFGGPKCGSNSGILLVFVMVHFLKRIKILSNNNSPLYYETPGSLRVTALS